MRVSINRSYMTNGFYFRQLEYSKHLILSVWELNYLFRILFLRISYYQLSKLLKNDLFQLGNKFARKQAICVNTRQYQVSRYR